MTASAETTGGGETAPGAASGAAAVLTEALLSCAERVDLSRFSIPPSDLGGLYAEVLYSHPELFHVALRLSYTAAGVGERRTVTEVYPIYLLTGEELTAARVYYRDTVTAILAEMDGKFGDHSPTEAEIVLYLHDLLADRYAYDTRADGQNTDAYHFFRDGTGVCQAYALAFMALAAAVGLEADFVASAEMDHAWNHVRVDGVWYHVDVTRDDPIPAVGGVEEVGHSRLLRSDEGMAALGYVGFSCAGGHSCTDTRYEPSGMAALADFREALVFSGDRVLGSDGSGAPVAVSLTPTGISTGPRGDIDSDGAVTPADLLTLYGDAYPEAWRARVRDLLCRGYEALG